MPIPITWVGGWGSVWGVARSKNRLKIDETDEDISIVLSVALQAAAPLHGILHLHDEDNSIALSVAWQAAAPLHKILHLHRPH